MSQAIDIVRDWLKALGALVAASMSAEEAHSRLSAFVPLLVDEFSERYFSPDSLRFVAKQCKFFPTYGELVDHLNAWSRQVKPQHVALQNDSDLPEKDQGWLAYWHRRKAEGFAPLRNEKGALARPEIRNWRRHTETLIQHYAPNAWQILEREERA